MRGRQISFQRYTTSTSDDGFKSFSIFENIYVFQMEIKSIRKSFTWPPRSMLDTWFWYIIKRKWSRSHKHNESSRKNDRIMKTQALTNDFKWWKRRFDGVGDGNSRVHELDSVRYVCTWVRACKFKSDPAWVRKTTITVCSAQIYT